MAQGWRVVSVCAGWLAGGQGWDAVLRVAYWFETRACVAVAVFLRLVLTLVVETGKSRR